MTINYEDNEYIKIGNYSNILYEYHKVEAADRVGWTVNLHEKMALMLHKLSMAHPDWTFVVRGGARDLYAKCWRNAHDTRVICEDEVIGEIKLDTWKSGTPFEIDCSAISAARARRGGAWTTKPEKAYKLVEENFRVLSLTERFRKTIERVKSTVGSNVWGATRKFSSVMDKLERPLAAYVAAHLDEIKEALPASLSRDLDTLVEYAAELEEATKLNNAMQNNIGITVLVHGDIYYLSHDGFATYDSMPSHVLPGDIAGKIGVLKAFDQDGTAIDNIGIRINKNTYFIL